MPTNNQTGASVGPFEVQQCYPIGDFRLLRNGKCVATGLTKALAVEFASAPTLLAENLALKAAVAEMRRTFRDYLKEVDQETCDDSEAIAIDGLTDEFNALFDPLTGAKGGDDES